MEQDKLNVVFASYREWASDVGTFVADHPRISRYRWIRTEGELELALAKPPFDIDLVMLCGWSWPPQEWMVNSGVSIVSEHPAASDRYTPGSPLQNQILDGLTVTKHRIVKVGFPELAPRLYSHEVDMSLEGSMDQVLDRMRATSIELYDAFLHDYPNVKWKPWLIVPSNLQVPRRTPQMSNLTHLMSGADHVLPFNAKNMYDRLRCLEAPYPNAYVEDDTGRLYFERVRFEPKGDA